MIKIKTKEEIKIMAENGRILALIMKKLKQRVKPGVTTKELDKVAEDLVLKYGGQCSFKGYQGFPACLCTSINQEIVHSLPSSRILRQGDIISLDLGFFYNKFHADIAVTVPVGEVDSEALRLIRATKKALKRGIKKIKPGNTIGDIGNTIQRYVESQGFNVVKELCGHGIGKELHEDPQILNYGKRRSGDKIEQGMVLCIEPIIAKGDWRLKEAKDGFGLETADGLLSAHFEHTIAVTKTGHQVLTK